MSSITPTIGRKVWFWMSEATIDDTSSTVLDDAQAFDATVVFVHENGAVNLTVVDHEGGGDFVENVPFREYIEGETCHGGFEDFATWMPYQMGQAKKAFEEAKKEESGS